MLNGLGDGIIDAPGSNGNMEHMYIICNLLYCNPWVNGRAYIYIVLLEYSV